MKNEINRIVNDYSDMLIRVAIHYVKTTEQAEDIAQNVFLKYIQKPETFTSLEHEKAWFIRVCINLSKDYLKSTYNRKKVSLEEYQQEKEESYQVIFKDDTIINAVKSLPDNQKNTIYLFYYEGMSVKEISQILKTKESTVLSWLKRGRDKLKVLLEGEEFHV